MTIRQRCDAIVHLSSNALRHAKPPSTGEFKSETGSEAPSEFVGSRAKMYSLNVPNQKKQSKIRTKCIKKVICQETRATPTIFGLPKNQKVHQNHFRTFRSKNHTPQAVEISKTCLNASDDKRYILDEGVTTLAYGHCRLPRDCDRCIVNILRDELFYRTMYDVNMYIS